MKPIFVLLFLYLLNLRAQAQPFAPLPPHSKILFFGDSQTSFAFGEKGNAVQYQNFGFVAWVNALSAGIQIPKGGLLAIPGETTRQMVKRLQPIHSFGAKILVVLAGTNDVLFAVPPDTVKANLRRIYNEGLTGGMRVIALTIPPQYNPPEYHTIVEDFRQNINAWIRTQTDVTVLDLETEFKNPALYEDGRHLTPQGALLLGQKVAAVLNSWTTFCQPGSGSTESLGFAGNANPFFTGTGGRKSGATGMVANDWQLTGNLGITATITASKAPGTNGKEKQVIALSGNYTGEGRQVALFNETVNPPNLPAGRVVEGVAELELAEMPTGIRGILLRADMYNADYSQLLGEGTSMAYTSTKNVNFPSGTFLLRTPPITIGSGGAVAHMRLRIEIDLLPTATLSPVEATIRISSAGLQALPLADGPLAQVSPAGSQPVCGSRPLVLSAANGAGYTFQWQKDGAGLAGQTAASLSVTTAGSYTALVSLPGCSVLSAPVLVTTDCGCAPPYRFTGSGPWSHAANWQDGRIPPITLPPCAEIIIDPQPGGECIMDRSIYLDKGAQLKVIGGKRLRVAQ